jgi:hypothetical protein
VAALRTLGNDLQNEYIQNLVAELENKHSSFVPAPEFVKLMRAALRANDPARIKEIRLEAKNSGVQMSERASHEWTPLIAAVQTVRIALFSVPMLP